MNIKEEQFNTAQKTFSQKALSDVQKSTMLSSIYASTGQTVKTPVSSHVSPYALFFRQRAVVAMALILLVSGTTYASAKSLPGDLLYGLKVNVVEPATLVLHFSEQSKNEYKISLLQKRIDELQSLQQRSTLDQEAQIKSSEATDKNVKELETSAVFNSQGQNSDISEKIKAYNATIDSNLQIQTNIKAKTEPSINLDTQSNLEKVVSNPVNPLGTIYIQTESKTEIPVNKNIPSNMQIAPVETKIPKL